MTRIKMCGLRRMEDIEAVNEVRPEYIGFVFFPGSRRYITAADAGKLREKLNPEIRAVGVFVDEDPETVAALLEDGIIDMAQLHGHEDERCLENLRRLTGKPLIRAFRVRSPEDLQGIRRPYFLAGGLDPQNVSRAVRGLKPFAVDVSSGIETGGYKDINKMRAFVRAVRMEMEKA